VCISFSRTRVNVTVVQANLEMSSDVHNPFHAEADGPRPAHDWKTYGDGDADEPEPEEGVDLLVEEVDGQDALKRVTVHGAHLPYAEVAQSHRWKPLRPCSDGHRTADHSLELVTGHCVENHLDSDGQKLPKQLLTNSLTKFFT